MIGVVRCTHESRPKGGHGVMYIATCAAYADITCRIELNLFRICSVIGFALLLVT